jgi:hypothetical protein
VAISRDVARANFAAFVVRALASARSRGLNDQQIREATGVGPSTFHRWRRADWGRDWPELQKVIDFCEGLGFDPEDGFAALGVTGTRSATGPEPLDPDVRRLLAKMADPNVGEHEKTVIRALLRYLADLPPGEEPPTPARRAR